MSTGQAEISACGTYRYALWRRWAPAGPGVLFIGLNPSTADAATDDPTLRRCMGYARSWGFGWVSVGNLFGLRSTDPGALRLARDPVGPGCDVWLGRLLAEADLVVAAWGARGGLLGRDREILGMIEAPHCLAVTKDGHPGHPLRLPRDARARPYNPS